MISQILIISLIKVIYYCCAEKIGDYSDVIPNYESCGISKNTLMDKTDCFEYHKDMLGDNVRDGRKAENGEAPWIVQVKATKRIGYFWNRKTTGYYCGGTLFAEQWVLTAAHCLDLNARHYKISTNHEWEKELDHSAQKVFKHELFERNGELNWEYDIGLIKLERRLNVEKGNDSNEIVSICLPSPNFSEHNNIPAHFAGYGTAERRLQITMVALTKVNDRMWGSRVLLGSKLCMGDSGSGIWVYEMGRAVLIGIQQSHSDIGQCDHHGLAAYVPHFVNWILDKIKNN